MRKPILIFILFLFFCLSARTQTHTLIIQSSGTNKPLWSVYFTNISNGYSVGNNGTIVKTINGGNTWSALTSGTTNHLYSVFFTNNNTGWAVGANCTILKTTNGGTTWSSQSSGITNDHFFSVYFPNEHTGYIATQKGSILKTTDGGTTWINQRNQVNPFLASVYFTSPITGFAVGGTGYNGSDPSRMKIIKTTDGGTTWTEATTGITDGILHSVYFYNTNYGYAVGIKDSGNAVILKTIDGGTTWTQKVLTSKSCLRAVTFTDINTGYCTGDGGYIFKTSDRGTTWTDISDPSIKQKNSGLYAVFFISPNVGWIMDSDGSIVKYNSPSGSTPSLSTKEASSIDLTTASSGGNITSDGGSAITSRGICWSTSINPTISDSKTIDGNGTGLFSGSLTGLTQGTTYYVRAYATNSTGTYYGNQISFTTLLPKTIPTISTTVESSITSTSAISGGNITSDGNATIIARGICWGTSANPTISNNKTTNGTGAGSFTSTITGLVANTTYYVRAYATNSAGTAYGSQVSFTTLAPVTVPVVSTTAISSISPTSASSGGNITSDGGSAVTASGVCWNTSANPTTSNNKTTDGTGSGSFTSSITGLTANTTYYVRAYATNIVGTAYGSQVSFTTTSSTGSVSDCDGNTYNTVTIGTQLWMKENLKTTKYNDCTPIPLITDNDAWYNAKTSAYCWYNNDEATYKNTYGALYNWYTVNTGKLCPVGWHVPSEIEMRTMVTFLILNGYNFDGTTYGDPWSNNKTGKALTSTQGWSVSIDNGSIGNSDYPEKRNITGFSALPGGMRSYVGFLFSGVNTGGSWWLSNELSNSNAWHYSMSYLGTGGSDHIDNKNFGFSVRCKKDNPSEILLPSVVTSSWIFITGTSGTSGANITSDGGATVTARGVCWSTSDNPTISNSKTTDGTGTGSFVSSITGLTPNKMYYLRAYATNSAGTSYGYQKNFTTSSAVALPILSTTTVISITSSTASGGGNITSDGGNAVTARGVCWSTSANPTTSNSKTTNGNGTGSFTSSITGLTANTTYYVRAYATNSAGTAYGSQVSFTTLSAADNK